MKIEFTQEQYERLLKLVYLGNYMVNGVRAPEDTVQEYAEMESFIFSFAADMGLSHLVVKENGKFCPSIALDQDEEMNEHIEIYDEVTFMDELEARLEASDECEDECDDEDCEDDCGCDFDEVEDGILKD